MTVTNERWRDLCKQAAIEKDPVKLVKLCDEINAILQKASQESLQNDGLAGTANGQGFPHEPAAHERGV